MSLQPRRLSFSGVVRVEALLLDPARLGLGVARRRALDAIASRRAVVLELDRFLVVRWAEPQALDVSAAVGAPLVRQGDWLSSVPLDVREREALDGARGGWAVAEGGVLRTWGPEAARPAPLGSWIDPAALRVEPSVSLGSPPPPPAPARAPEPPAARARAALLGAAEARTAEQDAGPEPSAAPWSSRALAALARLAAWLGGGRARASSARDARPSGQHGGTESGATARRPGWFARAMAELDHWLRTRVLGAFFGAQNTRYLEDMMAMFERGRIDEALRRAIPLATGESARAPAAPGLLAPRSDLKLSPRSAGPKRAATASEGLMAQLRATYRRAFEHLDRMGRRAEAAYVLAELLGEVDEAVGYLERHGLFGVAAEFAEARDLSPALRVRLWLLAGDLERALEVATRTGAFEAAVLQLEATNLGQAHTLRVAWADRLATRGAYAEAVEVVRPVRDARALAERWAERALAAGGPAAWRVMADLAAARPDAVPSLLPRVRELARDPDGLAPRAALAEALVKVGGEGPPRLAGALVRAVLSDLERTRGDAPERLARGLVGLAGDRALEADLPTPLVRARRAPSPGYFELGAARPGLVPISDAVWLPSGRVALACGEGGIVVVDRTSAVVQRFSTPAERLVASFHGDRVLAVVQRGRTQIVHRVDLLTSEVVALGALELQRWASVHDGAEWYVATAQGVSALAVAGSRAERSWHVDVGGAPVAIAHGPKDLLLRVAPSGQPAGEPHELWRYALPDRTLRIRKLVPERRLDALGLDGSVVVFGEHTAQVEVGAATWSVPGGVRLLAAGGAEQAAWVPSQSSRPTVMVTGHPSGLVCLVEVEAVALRYVPGALVVIDQLNRVVVVRDDADAPVVVAL